METKVLPDHPDRKIAEIYAWITVDPKTNLEGICAVSLPEVGELQAVSSNGTLMKSLRPLVEQAIHKRGYYAKLMRFGAGEVIEEIKRES